MLRNAPTLAIRGLDTAENGPSKVCQATNKIRHNIGDYQGRRELSTAPGRPALGARHGFCGAYALLADHRSGAPYVQVRCAGGYRPEGQEKIEITK